MLWNSQKLFGTSFKIKEGSKLGNGIQFVVCCVLTLKAITRTPKTSLMMAISDKYMSFQRGNFSS